MGSGGREIPPPGYRPVGRVRGVRIGVLGSAEGSGHEVGSDPGGGVHGHLDYCVEAEALGFHSSFQVEHHFTGWNQVSATLMLQACVATRTTTLRLGTAVIVLPWHNPVLLAEQAATLDLVSGGRLDLGVGKGYRHNEFTGFSIPPEEADARFDEAIEVLTRSWSSRTRFSHQGRFWQFEDIVVEPSPTQRPHPPLWVAAASEASIRRAARRGFNLILDQYASTAQIGERIALYRAERTAHGRSFDPMQVAVARQAYVARDSAEAAAALERLARSTKRTVEVSRAPGAAVAGSHVLSYAGTPGATEAHALYGTPDHICRELDALRCAGVAYVLLAMGPGAREQLRRFAREIMPAQTAR
jgi:alkanesulfonate monooxygenase SsuD/methylene tetrahydromethanopterin reductase-like flavin-dependent oxidoreductase (luciferase family)